MEGTERDELELSLPYPLQYIGDTLFKLTSMYYNNNVEEVEADDDDSDNSFVFQIDESSLIDPRLVLLDKMIGEGSYATVHKGL
ncbi:hypothetical protein Goklo_020690 [Gossypium klotzschianum]|nr:hypothetical protein [Gossypium klotzschianum]